MNNWIISFILCSLFSPISYAGGTLDSQIDSSSFLDRFEALGSIKISPDGKLAALFSAKTDFEGPEGRSVVYPRFQIIDLSSGQKLQDILAPKQYDMLEYDYYSKKKHFPAKISWSADSRFVLTNNRRWGYSSNCSESSYAYLFHLQSGSISIIRENDSSEGNVDSRKCVRTLASFQPGGSLILLVNHYVQAGELTKFPDEILLLDSSLNLISNLTPKRRPFGLFASNADWSQDGNYIIIQDFNEYFRMDLNGKLDVIDKATAELSLKKW